MLPKHHLFIHLLCGVVKNGNPKCYWTFLDESENKKLASVARAAYATVWEPRIFTNLDALGALCAE